MTYVDLQMRELLSQQHKGLPFPPNRWSLTYMRFSWKRFLRLSRKALSLVWASRRTKSWMPTRSRAFREDSMFLRIWLHLSSRLCVHTGAVSLLRPVFLRNYQILSKSHTLPLMDKVGVMFPTSCSVVPLSVASGPKCPWLHPQI